MKALASSGDMRDLSIRRAASVHVPELMSICAEHAAYERLPHVTGVGADTLADALQGAPPRLYAWLAFIDQSVVGYASATLDFATLERSTYLHMDCLYVRSAWRNQAIGQRLWDGVLELATSLGCRAIQWQTPAWNEGAARFYRRLGASESAKLRYVLPLRGA